MEPVHALLLPHCSLVPPPPSPPLARLPGPASPAPPPSSPAKSNQLFLGTVFCCSPAAHPPHASPHLFLVTSQIRPVVRFLREPNPHSFLVPLLLPHCSLVPPHVSPPRPPPRHQPNQTSQWAPALRFFRECKPTLWQRSKNICLPFLSLPVMEAVHLSLPPPPSVTSQIRLVVRFFKGA